MRLDATRFLALTVSIAATTMACAQPAAEEEVGAMSEGALSGATCGATSIKQPRQGTARAVAFPDGFCHGLARSVQAPDAEGITSGYFGFIEDHCNMYSTQLQPAVAASAYACLKKADDARPRNAAGQPTQEFDATTMYECGWDAMKSVCNEGIDGRVNAQKDLSGRGRCDRIVDALAAQATMSGMGFSAAKELNACNRVLSAMKSSGRAQMERCITEKGYDIYTCAEGLDGDLTLVQEDDPRPTVTEACIPADAEAQVPGPEVCDALNARVRMEGDSAAQRFIVSRCHEFRTQFKPAAAKLAIECLSASAGKVSDKVYECGQKALRKICRDPQVVDGLCDRIVKSVVADSPTANAGGRLTRQCRTLLAGLSSTEQTAAATCVMYEGRPFGDKALTVCLDLASPVR